MTKELYFKEHGNMQGQTVLLLHGFCGSSKYWENVIPLLSKDMHVIVPDLRGHGESPSPEGGFSIEDMAEDVHRLIEKLGTGKVFLFGHSLGGYVTLAFAEKYRENLAGYGLIHSTAFPDSQEAKEGRLNSIKKIGEEGIEPFVDQLVPKLFANPSQTGIVDSVRLAKEIGAGTSPQGAIETLNAMRNRTDRNHVLKKETTPVLLTAGKGDKVITPDSTFSVSGGHITQILLEHSGHMSMYEEPEKLAESLQEFIRLHTM